MAAAQLSVTRRALLAGAPLFPLILSGAEPGRSAGSKDAPLVKGEGGRSWPNFRLTFEPSPAARPGPWTRALARFRAADTALAAVADSDDDALYDRALGRWNAALKRLLRAPAPALPALALKLDLLVAHEFWEITGADRCFAALRDDALEFVGDEAAMKVLKQDARRLAASAG
jgi:hypothetical protein